MAFNLFGLGKNKTAPGPKTVTATTVMDDGKTRSKGKAKPSGKSVALPKINLQDLFGKGQNLTKRMQMVGAVLAFTLLSIVALVIRDSRDTAHATAYISLTGELRLLTQQLGKAATRSLQGNSTGFIQFRESTASFSSYLGVLTNGGELEGRPAIAASPDAMKIEIEAVNKAWAQFTKDSALLLEQEKSLIALGREVGGINKKNSQLHQLVDAYAKSSKDSAAAQMPGLVSRIGKNAGALLIGDAIDPEVALNLTRDGAAMAELLAGAKTAADANGKQQLAQIEKVFNEDMAAIKSVMGNIQKLVLAKQAGARIIATSDELLLLTNALNDGYQKQLGGRAGYYALLVLLSIITVGLMVVAASVFFIETQKRSEEAETQRVDSERTNRTNQDAILRLMNELGDLADGDLTVTATVSEDITGAIADSINYTIEELRVLVGRINDAARRVTVATESAQEDSVQLLAAAERQSHEIQNAGRSVLDMARSMNMVSNHATQSAQVARQSLSAAEKGAVAVQDSIKGMNEIRDQIQETSKRIKRLGESSQEIGEIVELISDITEQTNVLALNAAIQAASAGEAGRGFTVVAEEVQRLAERSAEATKQIAAIVKTIQTDTQDAVSAMEQSTQGVVEGAKRSDAAGQALSEIGQVSRNLTQLIENISVATQKQAQSAGSVAEAMKGILHITEQTTAGTKKTTAIVGELAALATELKGSVAGFKVN